MKSPKLSWQQEESAWRRQGEISYQTPLPQLTLDHMEQNWDNVHRIWLIYPLQPLLMENTTSVYIDLALFCLCLYREVFSTNATSHHFSSKLWKYQFIHQSLDTINEDQLQGCEPRIMNQVKDYYQEEYLLQDQWSHLHIFHPNDNPSLWPLTYLQTIKVNDHLYILCTMASYLHLTYKKICLLLNWFLLVNLFLQRSMVNFLCMHHLPSEIYLCHNLHPC